LNRLSLNGIALLATVSVALSLSACHGKQEGAEASGTASAPQAASVLTVEIVTPQTQTWPQTVSTSGALAAWQEIIVSPETGGLRIAELLVDVGARVKRGQLLARLSDESLVNDLTKQEAVVAQAQSNLDQAVSNARRAKEVENSGGLSAQSIEQYRITEATSRASLASAKADLAATQLKLRQTRVVAPDDGLVASKTGILGNVVNAGTELFRLVRQSRVEWLAEVDARQLAQLREGQVAHLSLPDGQRIDGHVRLVGPVLSMNTGRALAYVSLPVNSPARVGMFANGTIDLADKAALTLPQSALVARDGRDYVYLLGAGNKVRSVPITTGRRQQQRIEVLGGIAGDAKVVASGGAFLSDGAQVTVNAPKAASAAAGQ